MTAPARASSSRSGPRAKVLVIDDDEFMRDLFRLHLSNAGYEVIVADDGIVGGHLALTSAPDLVLVDVQMPHMSGYELVDAMKADETTRHIPMIFVTSDDDVGERSGKLGAQAYLKKPVNSERLLELVALFTSRV
jgi:twitching motility two-component system response regulator PilH